MTTEEVASLRSSAKQWLRHGSTGYCCDYVVRAWLADHPANDAEPITEEWLRSVGFMPDDCGTGDMFASVWLPGEEQDLEVVSGREHTHLYLCSDGETARASLS